MKWKGKIDFEEHPEYDGNPLLSTGAGEFNALPEKTSASGNDLAIIEDSEDSFAKAKMKLSTINDLATSTIKQIVTKNITTKISTTTSIAYGSTPTSASGDAWDSQAITLTDATNAVRIQLSVPFDSNQDGDGVVVLIHRSTTVLAVLPGQIGKKQKSGSVIYVDFYDIPGNVGPITYYFRVGIQAAGTTEVNQLSSDSTPWGDLLINQTFLTLTEMDLT